MSDFLILRAGSKFRLGSGIAEEREFEIWSNLLSFLRQNSLLAVSFEIDAESMEGRELRSSHLTEKGVLVIRDGLDKWMRWLDKGKPAADVSILQKSLTKFN